VLAKPRYPGTACLPAQPPQDQLYALRLLGNHGALGTVRLRALVGLSTIVPLKKVQALSHLKEHRNFTIPDVHYVWV
jgi:hypothetical protein